MGVLQGRPTRSQSRSAPLEIPAVRENGYLLEFPAPACSEEEPRPSLPFIDRLDRTIVEHIQSPP